MAFLICSCANEDVKTAETDNIKTYNVDSIRQVFNPVINGIWLAEEYYQALEKTKSPYKAYEKAGIITGLLIEKQGGDSLSISVNNSNHEGTSFIAWYRPGHTENALPLNLKGSDKITAFTELGYEINEKDTFLFIYFYNNANTIYDKIKFRKVSPTGPGKDLAFGVEYAVNNLVAGKYTYPDNMGQINRVEFTRDGKVSGFDYMTTYSLLADFAMEEYKGDKIFFNSDIEPAIFGFELNNDTLNLYGLDLSEDGKWSRMELAHKLTPIN